MTSPSDLIKECLLEDEIIQWNRVVPWREQRYGYLLSWLGVLPVATIAIGLLVLYSIDASFQTYSIFLIVALAVFSGIVGTVYARGAYNDVHEASSDRRIIVVQNLSDCLYMTSVMFPSIIDASETSDSVEFTQSGKNLKVQLEPLPEPERSNLLQMVRSKMESTSKPLITGHHTLPDTGGSLIALPRKLKESMLTQGDTETLFISSITLFRHIWPLAIMIFVPMIPGTVVSLLVGSSASKSENESVANVGSIASNLIFVGIGIKILVGCTLAVASGLFGKRHFVVSNGVVYTAVSFFGDRGLSLLRRYSLSEFVDRAQLYSSISPEQRGAWRFLFPDSAFWIKPESYFEINRFPLYANHAKAVYDWAVSTNSRDNAASGEDSFRLSDAVV